MAFILLYLYQGRPLPDNIWHFLFFMQSIEGIDTSFFNVSWSMAVEEIFYVAFPILIVLFSLVIKQRNRVFWAALICMMAFSMAVRFGWDYDLAGWDTSIRKSLIMRIDSIAYGAMFGIFITHISRRAFYISVLCALMITVFLLFSWKHMATVPYGRIGLDLVFIACPVVCAAIVTYAVKNWHFENTDVIRFLADISYPLYIFHPVFLKLFFPDGSVPSFEKLVLTVCFIIAFSYGFFRFVETPILKRRPRY
ncbi:MAG: hypothetical protein CMH27_07500 [Micavibrio sp.]|nr:hypothetical protein [Micavibrio sp.]